MDDNRKKENSNGDTTLDGRNVKVGEAARHRNEDNGRDNDIRKTMVDER